MSSAAEILLPEIRGKLDGQRDALESARTRAAVALTLSGVVAGFFVQSKGKHVGNWEIAALVAFVVSGITGVYVLFGHKMRIVPVGRGWVDWAKDAERERRLAVNAAGPPEDTSGPHLAAQMADDMLRWYGLNKPMLSKVQAALAVTWAAVLLQILLWAISVL
jgi:hypothetical protein